jgi:hypothetical protein
MSVSTVDAKTNSKKDASDDTILTLDRRRKDRRDLEGKAEATTDASPRRKQQRRRHIDPTTCERDYSESEVEFMKAMDEYKQSSGRMFPTCSEVLEVIRDLGYVQLTDEQYTQLGLEEDELQDSTDSDDEETEWLK